MCVCLCVSEGCAGHRWLGLGAGLCRGLCARRPRAALGQAQPLPANSATDDKSPLRTRTSGSQRSPWCLCSNVLQNGQETLQAGDTGGGTWEETQETREGPREENCHEPCLEKQKAGATWQGTLSGKWLESHSCKEVLHAGAGPPLRAPWPGEDPRCSRDSPEGPPPGEDPPWSRHTPEGQLPWWEPALGQSSGCLP